MLCSIHDFRFDIHGLYKVSSTIVPSCLMHQYTKKKTVTPLFKWCFLIRLCYARTKSSPYKKTKITTMIYLLLDYFNEFTFCVVTSDNELTITSSSVHHHLSHHRYKDIGSGCILRQVLKKAQWEKRQLSCCAFLSS